MGLVPRRLKWYGILDTVTLKVIQTQQKTALLLDELVEDEPGADEQKPQEHNHNGKECYCHIGVPPEICSGLMYS